MTTSNLYRRLICATGLLATMISPAAAHIGGDHTHAFTYGLMHPIGGLDHVLAMLAVGILAANLGGRSIWLVPVSFVLMMVVGGSLGIAGVDVPFVEIGIAASVVVLGLAVALNLPLQTLAAMTLVGFFAIFHGHAHGVEMPADASGVTYAAGFMLATTLLHVAGIGLGVTFQRLAKAATAARLSQAGGSAMTLAGIGILTGWL